MKPKTEGEVFKGDLTAEAGKVYEYERVTGSIYAGGADTKTAFPKLTSVGGDIYASSGNIEKGAFPKLTSVGGYIYAPSGKIEKGAFPKLTSVGGDIYASSGNIEKGAFPKLTSVGGYIYAPSGKIEKGAFPKLTSVGGYIYAPSGKIEKGAFPNLTSVGGYIYATSGKIEKGAFPNLTSVGGNISAPSGDFSHVKVNDANAANRCRAMLLASFAAAGFSFADGILSRIVSQRGPVSRVVICGKTEISFLVTDGEAFSHGATLAEARDGLI